MPKYPRMGRDDAAAGAAPASPGGPPAAPAASEDAAVRGQYECYPYPARDPADEDRRLITGSPSHLLEIGHYLWGAGRPPAPLRVLVAGGGTGDALVMLAQQLHDAALPAAITYLDVSAASRRIAEARIARRGLGGVTFVTGSLLDAGQLAPGPYDYVDCTGVLHHLADPLAGARALAAVLAPGGGIGLMVYGTLGRSGVYDVQEILRRVAGTAPEADRLAVARRLLAQLPPTNRLVRNPVVGDHRRGDDAGLYDLLLHRRDRAYRVPELIALVRDAGLRPASFVEPARYRPETYLGDPALRRRLPADPWEAAALAELIAGNMASHVLYAVRADNDSDTVADPERPDAVPAFRDVDGPSLAHGLRPGGTLTARSDGLTLTFPLPARAPALAARIDGATALGALHERLVAETGAPRGWEDFLAEWRPFYRAFNGINRLLIRG